MTTSAAELGVAGWSPRWWGDGIRTPLWWAAAVLVPALLLASTYTAYDLGFPASLCAVFLIALGAEVVVGLLFWMWRPRNIIGPLLVAYPALYALPEELIHLFPQS